jgi:TatA/E family protein of Tat protein translocase
MPFNIGPFELLLVLVLALLVLGPGKLPEVGNALGRTIREFRKATTDIEDSVRLEPVTPVTSTAAAPAAPVSAAPVTAATIAPVPTAPAAPTPEAGDVRAPTTGEHQAS